MEVLQAEQAARKTGHTNEVMVSMFTGRIRNTRLKQSTKGLTTRLANLKSQLETLSERNLTMQEAIDKKMEAYQQKVSKTLPAQKPTVTCTTCM